MLLVVGAEILPQWPALTAVGMALGLLLWSFGRDIRYLWRVRNVPESEVFASPRRTAADAVRHSSAA